jgi:PAS domain S-box-containing protein
MILESVADGILAVDTNGKVIETNLRFAELWRIPQRIMESRNDRSLLEFVLGQLRDPMAFLQKVQALYRSDAIDVDTLAFRDGRVFERHSYPMIQDGALVGRVWSFRDITEQKMTGESLRIKNLVFDESMAANSIADLAGIITEANDMHLRIWGYQDKREVIGKSIADFLNDPQEAAAIVKALDQAGQWEGSYTARRKDGSTFIAYGLATVLRNEKGKMIGYQSSVMDITGRVKAEAEVRKLQKLTSIGTLAGGLAHDFNNILMGLFGQMTLAKGALPADHPASGFLHEAELSMSRATRLTQQLLTFAKGGEPIKENVSLETLVEEAARFDLSGSKVRLVYQQAEGLWMAEADKGQIQQVISNLTINARDAMPQGGTLSITLDNAVIQQTAGVTPPPGRYVRITVRDEGIGISPNDLDRIFDPYFTTKRTGHGLGLAMVYSIINKHRGHIDVASDVGKGTTFTLYLPACQDAPRSAPAPARDKAPALGRSARVLIMDDERAIRYVVSTFLTQFGFSTVTASDGEEAIARYRQAMAEGNPFDVVIMDLTVPGGVGGKEAVKSLLAMDPQAKVIVSSGYAEDPVMANYREYGFKGTLTKPYTKSRMREVLEEALR